MADLNKRGGNTYIGIALKHHPKSIKTKVAFLMMMPEVFKYLYYVAGKTSDEAKIHKAHFYFVPLNILG